LGLCARIRFLLAGCTIIPLCTLLLDVRVGLEERMKNVLETDPLRRNRRDGARSGPTVHEGRRRMVGGGSGDILLSLGHRHRRPQGWLRLRHRHPFCQCLREHATKKSVSRGARGLTETAAIQGHQHVLDVANVLPPGHSYLCGLRPIATICNILFSPSHSLSFFIFYLCF